MMSYIENQKNNFCSLKRYNYLVLLIFALTEVIFFGQEDNLSVFFSLSAYVFIAIVFFCDRKLGIMYYVSFTLLTFGIGNYDSLSLEPKNFWGLRVFGFSFNIIFSIFMFAAVLLTNNKKEYFVLWFKEFRFFIFFFLYSLVIGVIYTLLYVNYLDNFFLDFLTYSPIVIYSYLIFKLDLKSVLNIIKYCFSITVISFLFCYLLGRYFQYSGDKFFPSNAVYFILPFALLFLRKLFPYYIQLFLILTVTSSFVLGYYFISGKVIMIALLLILVALFSNKMLAFITVILLILVVPNFSNILEVFISYYPEGGVIRGKFIQIQQAVDNIDLHVIALIPSSMGNIIAEMMTVLKYFSQNIFYIIFGKGFGGGVKDIYGYLDPWTEINGYAAHDAVRNDFFKMHLAIYEVFVKSGLIGWSLYLILLVKGFLSKNKFFLLHSVLLFAVFYVSKETLLLTLMMYRLRDFYI